jgi:uncharacterized Tic20 family protein
MSADDDRARAGETLLSQPQGEGKPTAADETLLSQPPAEPGKRPEAKPAATKKESFFSRHFETVVAVLIAIVTVSGAFVAWRSSTVGSGASDAERQGVLSSVSRERVQTDNRTRLYNELRIFATYTQYQEMASLLQQDAQKLAEAGQDEQAESLLQEADSDKKLASSAYSFLTYPQYVKEDDKGRKVYDVEGYMQASLDIDARTQDLNPDDDLQKADRLHLQEQWLVGIVIVLAVALLFFTLAEITRSFLRYIFVTIGLFAFLAAVVMGAVVEVAALL